MSPCEAERTMRSSTARPVELAISVQMLNGTVLRESSKDLSVGRRLYAPAACWLQQERQESASHLSVTLEWL